MATKNKKQVVKKAKKIDPQGNVVKEPKKAKYELVSFSITATIPVQAYGNIQPVIVLKTKTLEEAKAIALPFIAELFVQYAERPRDGSAPAFQSKANVTVEEKKVAPTTVAPVAPVIPVVKTPSTVAPSEPAVKTNATKPIEEAIAEATGPKTPAFEKAEKAINGATDIKALDLIEDQIQKSTKLVPEEKPVLLTLVLKKRKTF